MVAPSSGSSFYGPKSLANLGLDYVTGVILRDQELLANVSTADLVTAAAASLQMSSIITKAIVETGVAKDNWIDANDVKTINSYIRSGNDSINTWRLLHGDDGNGLETGFHLIHGDGGTARLFGSKAIDTVAEGIFQIGFEMVVVDGSERFLNEDGTPSAKVSDVASWLNYFCTDLSTTGTGLDFLVDLIKTDKGLVCKTSAQDICDGASAANQMNAIIQEAIGATNAAADQSITAGEVREINQYIKANFGDLWVALHGDDECGAETGFHKVQNDGATSRLFGENAINTVADGIYHIGFDITGTGDSAQFLNEDGDPNATLTDVADWLTYLYTDPSTTGSGLDRMVDLIRADVGLMRNVCAGDINEGMRAADAMNAIILDAIKSTDALDDGWVTADDIRAMNAVIRSTSEKVEEWARLHGDDEGDDEFGFHCVQNDGATTVLFGKNAVNTVLDGIYHLGFEISGDRLLNEDGNANAMLADVASWLNFFVLGNRLIYGTIGANVLSGGAGADEIVALGGNDSITAGGGNDLVYAGGGNDIVDAGDGDDVIFGGKGNDLLTGGAGHDLFRFEKFDGIDKITDFETGDRIDISAVGATSFVVRDGTAGAVIDFVGPQEICLAGIAASDLVVDGTILLLA